MLLLFIKKYIKCWFHRATGFVLGNVCAIYSLRYKDLSQNSVLHEQMDFYATLADLWAKIKMTNLWILLNEKLEYVSELLSISRWVLIIVIVVILLNTISILFVPINWLLNKIWSLMLYVSDKYLIRFEKEVKENVNNKIKDVIILDETKKSEKSIKFNINKPKISKNLNEYSKKI